MSSTGRDLYLIDEIGKMELFSHIFIDGVKRLFDDRKDGSVVVMATIPVARHKSHWLVEELRKRKDCLLFEVLLTFTCMYVDATVLSPAHFKHNIISFCTVVISPHCRF